MFTQDLKFMIVSGGEKNFNSNLQGKYDMLHQMGADVKEIKFLNVAKHSWESEFNGYQDGYLKGDFDGDVSGGGSGYFSDGGNGSLDSSMSGRMNGNQDGRIEGKVSGSGRGESFIQYTAIIYYAPNPEKEKAYFEEQARLKREAEREEEVRLEQKRLEQERKAPISWKLP